MSITPFASTRTRSNHGKPSYAAVNRGIPAIAASASNRETSYLEVTNTTNPATWTAQITAKVVQQFINSTSKGAPILPIGYGVNVNIPALSSKSHDPAIVQTRFTGNAHINEAVLDPKKGTFTWANIKPYADGVNACINGDCSLPGETYVVENGDVSVSLFTVDYSAPQGPYSDMLKKKIEPLTSKE